MWKQPVVEFVKNLSTTKKGSAGLGAAMRLSSRVNSKKSLPYVSAEATLLPRRIFGSLSKLSDVSVLRANKHRIIEISDEILNLVESLILAQDERWRRA